MKVVINVCFGGFGLSHEACLRYLELAGKRVWVEPNEKFGRLIPYIYWLVPPHERHAEVSPEAWHKMPLTERQEYNARCSQETFYDRDIKRDDPFLVQVVEELGDKANGQCASLRVVEIPNDVQWYIEEYDGNEHIAEDHRTWSG